jgi:hypothetical protein
MKSQFTGSERVHGGSGVGRKLWLKRCGSQTGDKTLKFAAEGSKLSRLGASRCDYHSENVSASFKSLLRHRMLFWHPRVVADTEIERPGWAQFKWATDCQAAESARSSRSSSKERRAAWFCWAASAAAAFVYQFNRLQVTLHNCLVLF